jgi:hypothetical protein
MELEALPQGPAHGRSAAMRLAHYDANWTGMLRHIEQSVAEGASPAELLASYALHLNAYSGPVPDFLNRFLKPDLMDFAGLEPPLRVAVVGGRYAAVERLPRDLPIVDVVEQLIDDEVDCIVEFGSGLGFNLLALQSRLADCRRTYVAMEPSESGRQATRTLFRASPSAHLETHPFDYHQPDFSPLSRFRRIVAFTSHSIEQIPVLGTSFYQALLALPVVACAHAEPVGWQRFAKLAATVRQLSADRWLCHQTVTNFVYRFTDEHLVENSAMWATAAGYNTDLLPIIAAAGEAGDVVIRLLSYEAIGLNPINPSTLIAWTRAAPR